MRKKNKQINSSIEYEVQADAEVFVKRGHLILTPPHSPAVFKCFLAITALRRKSISLLTYNLR